MKLSILIPARNEKYLVKTVQDILSKIEDETEVLVGLDGEQPMGTLVELLKLPVKVISEQFSIGQRQMTNKLLSHAKGEYIMKVDAHCSFGKGFDRKMLEKMDARTIMAPQMLVLDAPTWTPRVDKKTTRYCFNTEMVMQYDKELPGELVDTMCLQGSAFMVLKDNYIKWELGDESMGSWGGQGVELGIKAYLNGGRCISNRDTWYAHMFRTSDKDFPYDRGEDPGKHANKQLIERYKNKSIRELIERFDYPSNWTKELVDKLPSVV